MDKREQRVENQRVRRILQFQDLAHNQAPFGSFLERWFPGFCKHWVVRCVHGDEIHQVGGRRRICLICGRALKGSLPIVCFFTGEPHR